jgi:hypothetical protein
MDDCHFGYITKLIKKKTLPKTIAASFYIGLLPPVKAFGE